MQEAVSRRVLSHDQYLRIRENQSLIINMPLLIPDIPHAASHF